MSRTPQHLVIDARPRGPSGPLAAERVLGRAVIDHLVELSEAVGGPGRVVAIHARQDEHDHLRALLASRPPGRYRMAVGPPPEDAAILRADRFYDPSRLKKALRRGRAPESAAIWRIDQARSLAAAEDELTRRRTFQPLGRLWATGPALALARWLAPTSVRPNAVTLASAGLMLVAAGLVGAGFRGWAGQVLPALALALALVLDTADGHLARLQGTASDFGRWLDANLDELGDMALHAAIAWSAFVRSGHSGWLVLGIVYAAGKYLFMFGTRDASAPSAIAGVSGSVVRPGWARRLAHWAGHADVRWHLWIALAAAGRLDAALVAYAAYFPARAAGGAIRKAVAHAS